MADRDELERWIEGSRRTQRKLKVGLIAGAVISVVLLAINRAAGGIAIAILALVALAGFWITGGHIADWEDKLYKLDHPEKPRAGHRRYQAD